MIHRQNLQFPEKDTALREDVHALGGLVGDVLRDQGGERLFEQVEGDRVAAIARREGKEGSEVLLVARTAGRESGEARDLIRAFSTWFEVVNLTERVHRVRRRREYLLHSDRPQPGGIGDCMYRLKNSGLDARRVLELLAGVTIYPVFTAHPTESTRRTMLRKQQQIADMMIERLDPTLTPFEQRSVWERIRTEVTSGWQTEVHPRERLTVADEREHVLFYLAEVVYRVVPALYEEIALWMQRVFGLPPELDRMPLMLRFGSWVGGDMDGNTEVHAKTIRETLRRQQQRVISAYFQECRALADKLSQSAGRVDVSRELEARIAEYDILLPRAREFASTRHDRMPYRIFLAQVGERLRTTYDGRPNHYESADQFVRDVELVAASLRANHGRHAGLFAVERLLCRALTFGFHLATLDVRQHASVHRDVVGQGLGREDWEAQGPQARTAALCESISRDRGPTAGFDAVGRRTLAVFETMMQARYKYGERAIGDYIVSGTESADDVLSALLLARWANITDRKKGEVPLDVVPLLETVSALEGAGPLLTDLLAEPSYRRHLDARGGRQTVLLGYSESNQAIGIAASRHAIYEAQVKVMQAARTGERRPDALLRARRSVEPRRRPDRAAGAERARRRDARAASRDGAGRGHQQQLWPAAHCAAQFRESRVRGRHGPLRAAPARRPRARPARADGDDRDGEPGAVPRAHPWPGGLPPVFPRGHADRRDRAHADRRPGRAPAGQRGGIGQARALGLRVDAEPPRAARLVRNRDRPRRRGARARRGTACDGLERLDIPLEPAGRRGNGPGARGPRHRLALRFARGRRRLRDRRRDPARARAREAVDRLDQGPGGPAGRPAADAARGAPARALPRSRAPHAGGPAEALARGRQFRCRHPRCAARERFRHRTRPAGDRLMAEPERSIVVYCASSQACDAAYHAVARRLGEILARAGCCIVYGGGRAGSMGALAEGALANGGRVVGVIPKFMVDLEWGHDDLSELHVVEDMRTRKHEMLTRASAVVALAGGTGTLEELFEAITLKRLGLFLGPIVIVNTKRFYDPLVAQLAAAIGERFMDGRHESMWTVVEGPEDVLPAIATSASWDAGSRDFAVVR